MNAADEHSAPIRMGALEILSDTQGVNFGPYLATRAPGGEAPLARIGSPISDAPAAQTRQSLD
jgi:hypothetical protein